MIHDAINYLSDIDNPAAAVHVVKFLLNCEPNVKLLKFGGTNSLLHFACLEEYDDLDKEAGIEVVKVFYDAHPFNRDYARYISLSSTINKYNHLSIVS